MSGYGLQARPLSGMIVHPQARQSTFKMRFVPLFLSFLATACAVAPQIQPETRAVRVTYLDHKSGNKIGLFNESNIDKTNYYAQMRKDASYKVVSDLHMGALMLQLRELNYFNDAAPNNQRVRGARSTIQIAIEGQTWTLAYVSGGTQEQLLQIQDCRSAIRAIYDANQSFQRVENSEGADYFKETPTRS
jgi:hypothetical protein